MQDIVNGHSAMRFPPSTGGYLDWNADATDASDSYAALITYLVYLGLRGPRDLLTPLTQLIQWTILFYTF